MINYGSIGDITDLTDLGGQRLQVGDVVALRGVLKEKVGYKVYDVYDRGFVICKDENGKGFALGIESEDKIKTFPIDETLRNLHNALKDGYDFKFFVKTTESIDDVLNQSGAYRKNGEIYGIEDDKLPYVCIKNLPDTDSFLFKSHLIKWGSYNSILNFLETMQVSDGQLIEIDLNNLKVIKSVATINPNVNSLLKEGAGLSDEEIFGLTDAEIKENIVRTIARDNNLEVKRRDEYNYDLFHNGQMVNIRDYEDDYDDLTDRRGWNRHILIDGAKIQEIFDLDLITVCEYYDDEIEVESAVGGFIIKLPIFIVYNNEPVDLIATIRF